MKRALGLLAALVLAVTVAPATPARADIDNSPPADIVTGAKSFRSVAKPTVSGKRAVGRTLTAKPKSKPAAATWTYQWYRNGSPIAGATAKRYQLVGADYRKRITVKATAWLNGYRQTQSKASKSGAKVKRGKLTTKAPTIGGAAVIGGKLTARTSGWSEGVRFSYQWFRNGKKIKKATSQTYSPTTTDKGKRLTVKVTGKLTGYATKTRTSKKTAKVKLAPIKEADKLRVGSFNVLVASATENSKNPLERPWSERLPAVVKQIRDEKLHVVGVQEASAGRVATATGEPQFQELADELGSGWALTNEERYCDTEANYARCPNGAGQNDRILYRTDRLELLRQGSRKLDTKGSYAVGNARFVTWAEFKDRNTGKRFFFVNTHLEPAKTAKKKTHAEQAALILGEIKSQNTAKLPVILVGDLAATKFSKPNAAHDAFVKAGYIDPLGNKYKQKTAKGIHAEKVVNGVWNSINYFEEKPQKVGGAYKLGSYLDYILVSSSRIRVLEWKTVVGRLDAKDRFADTLPSDHHLVRAVVVLP